MVTDSQELAKHLFSFATNLHFQQKNMDEILMNYRYRVEQTSNNCHNQAHLFSSNSDLITLMSLLIRVLPLRKFYFTKTKKISNNLKNKEIIKSIRNW